MENYATFLCSYNWFDYIHTYLDGGLKNYVQEVFRKTSANFLNEKSVGVIGCGGWI